MSFVKKTIASAAAIAALVAVPTATAVADDAPAQGVTVQAETQEGEWVVSFYDDDNNLIQAVGYKKADKQTFGAYALGVEAPAVDGKVFAGWATIDSNGNYSPVDPASVVTGDWAVYPMYKDAPEEGEWVVSFYDDDNNLIQAVGYKKADKQTFGAYALGVEAPAVDGKVFAGWATIDSNGNYSPVDPASVVTGDWAVYPMYKDAPEEGEWVVSFYDDDNNLIQAVGYKKADKQTFGVYALGVEAPAVDGKVFAGWATIASDGSEHPVDPASVVTGNWAVYPMYKDAPTEPEEPGKDDETTTPAEDEQKADENKPDENKSALGETGSAVLGVSVFALLLAAGSAVIFVMRKRV